MIQFNKKQDITPMKSVKDFSPKSVHYFFKFRGNDLYDTYLTNTKPGNVKLSNLPRGKWDSALVKNIIDTTKIIHPASHKEYSASPFIMIGKRREEYDPNFDLIFTIDRGGIILSPEFEYYIFLLYTLSKYRVSDSFDYRFVIRGNNHPSPIITVPRSKEGWSELMKALLEFTVSLKLFLGIHYRTILIEKNVPEAKNFSYVTSFIPTVTSLAYRMVISPILKERFKVRWDKANQANYSPGLLDKLVKYIEDNYKDRIVVGDCTTGSFFINLTVGENARRLRDLFLNPVFLGKNNIDPNRRRCELDWLAYAVSGIDNNKVPRDIIMISDLDPLPAIFHEFGHFLINNDKNLGSLQKASKSGVFSDLFVSFCSSILGFTGGILRSAIPEISAFVISFLLKFPLLTSEFMASWYGIQTMKKLGATDKDIENAKSALRLAFSSYIMSALGKMSVSGYGRVVGELFNKVVRR